LIAPFLDFVIALHADRAIHAAISTSRIYPQTLPPRLGAFTHSLPALGLFPRCQSRSSSTIGCSSLARPIYAQLLSPGYLPDIPFCCLCFFSFTLASSRSFLSLIPYSPTFVSRAKVAAQVAAPTGSLSLILPKLQFKATVPGCTSRSRLPTLSVRVRNGTIVTQCDSPIEGSTNCCAIANIDPFNHLAFSGSLQRAFTAMKSSSVLVVAVAGAALAKPHVHQHQKRDRVVVYKNVVEQACRLSGAGGAVLRNLAYSDCRAGLENGTYKAMGTGQFPFRGASTLITKTIIEVCFFYTTQSTGQRWNC
jgi:hypothetical protein